MGQLFAIIALTLGLALPDCPEYQAPPADARAEFFEAMFEACPGYVGSHGGVAYLYGTALARENRGEDALRVLINGMRAMEQVDPHTADLYVELVYRQRDYDRYDDAAERYLDLLGRIESGDMPADLSRRMLDELAPILSPENRSSLGLPEGPIPAEALAPGIGERLVIFWRQADRLPATVRNERLAEHLARIAYVRSNLLVGDGRIDDRAATYIRFGEPRRKDVIRPESGTTFSAERMHRQRERVGYMPEINVPTNEIWVYTNIDASIHFLFILDERSKQYRFGSATELLPRTWAGSLRRTTDFLHVMETLYRQLSLNHADYGLLYSDVANYNMTSRSGVSQAVSMPPRSFASSALSESQTLDYQIEQNQRDILPTDYTNIREDIERLPIEARVARFLAGDGSTRTEVYWGTAVEALYPDRSSRRDLRRYGIEESGGDLRFMLSATALMQGEDFTPIDRRVRRYNLGPFGVESGLLSPGPMILSEAEESYRLSLQWDLLAYDEDGRPGPLVKYQTETVGVIEPLDVSDGRFEVSDLKPMVLTDDGIPVDIDDEARIYPFRRLGADAQLALAFEVYNLTASDNGQYRYAIEYTVSREEGGGLLRRLIPGRQTTGDDATARASFDSYTSSDYSFLLVDLADWNANGPIEITLRFIDEMTGATVERNIDFDVSARLSSNRSTGSRD
jgi:GWxTD domain-containing protein